MKKAKPQRSLARRIVRVAVRFVGALVVLAVLAVLFLHTRWGKELVRARVEAALRDSIDGRVTLGSVDYGFLFDGIDLGQLEVRDRDGTSVLAIGALHVDVDRGSLLGGEPEVETLEVSGLAVAVVQRADGTLNLAGLAKPSDHAPLAHVHIAALHVTGAATIVQADGTTIALSDLVITGSLDARPATQAVDTQLTQLAAKVTVTRAGGAPPTVLELAVGGVTLGRRADSVEVDVHQLTLGALAIDRVHGRLALANNQLVGAQALALTGARVDHRKLESELGRALLVDDVRIDAAVSGPTNLLAIHGAVATGKTTLALDGTLDVSAPAHPRYQLAFVGTGASADVVPAGAAAGVPAIQTSIQLTLDGAGATLADLDARLALDVGPTQIGAIAVDRLSATAHAQRGAYTIEALSARGLGFEVEASGDLAADTTLHGRLAVAGSPSEAMAVLHAAGIEIPRKVPRIGSLKLAVSAAGKLDGVLDVTLEPTQLAVAGGGVAVAGSAQLAARAVTAASTTIALHGLSLRELARLAGKPPPAVDGAVSGTVTLTKTPTTRTMDYAVTVAVREPALSVVASGRADGVHATARAQLVRTADGAVLGALDASLPIDDAGLVPSRAWHVVLDLSRRPLAELVALAPPAMQAKLAALPPGDAWLRADLSGSPSAPRGTIDAGVTTVAPELGPVDAAVHATLAPSAAGGVTVATAVTVARAAAGNPAHAAFDATAGDELLASTGTLTLPPLFVGRAPVDPARLRAGIVIDEQVRVAERALGSWPRVPPALADLGGQVGALLRVHGSPANLDALAVSAQVGWRGYRLAAGGTGETQLELSGTPAHLTGELLYNGAVGISADVTRTGERLAVHTHMHADAPLRPLLPALPQIALPDAELGRLQWDMDATFAVDHGAVSDAQLTGSLAVRGGAFALPGNARRWHDIQLELTGDPRGVRLATLDVHELDPLGADHAIHASGLLAIDHLRPQAIELELSTHQWLALGPRSPLFTDAPQATVDLDAHVTADLTTPIPAIDATIDHLDLRAPDRHDRAHQPDVSSIAADVVYVDSLAEAGKLPHAERLSPSPSQPTSKGLDLDVRVHVPQTIHALKSPLDVSASGDLAVTVRGGAVVTTGQLVLASGTVTLFGKKHSLIEGHVAFDAAHPHGDLALRFARQLPGWSARELARPERGVEIRLTGDPAKPVVTLSGVENATLPDVFAMNFAGRPIFDPPPGRPASESVEVPRGDQLNVLAYLSLVIPHLLFLDRVAAWSDASEPRGAYGRIRNVELDRYRHGERTRIRVIARPQQPGRSTSEVQWDRLWIHDDHHLFGAGVRAGDRLGGGLGLFFEWSSAQ